MSKYTERPLDNSGQVWRGIDDKFPKKIHNATSTSDGLMSAKDKAKLDAIPLKGFDEIYDKVSWENDGLMSKEDKKKIDSIEYNANNYIHPNDENTRHVSDNQISYWDAKASTDLVTDKINGLMSTNDKNKLDNIQDNANNYIHPDDENTRHVTDEQIEYWNSKASTDLVTEESHGLMSKEDKYILNHIEDLATQDTSGMMSSEDKAKLDSIQEGARNYIHPDNEGIRHVSDAEKKYWNSKADKNISTNSEDGLMSYKDKLKLDGIEDNANNYIHPDNEKMRHVTDDQIKRWDSRVVSDVASVNEDGLMSKEDKRILDYLSSIDSGLEDKHYVTSEQKASIEKMTNVATSEKDGLMSFEDKIKLDKLKVPENFEILLLSTGWSNTQPFVQTLNIPNINENDNVYIGIDPAANNEEMLSASDARLKVQSVETGKITIVANGEKPLLDIPLIIMSGSNIFIIQTKQYTGREDYRYEAPTTDYHYKNEVIYSLKPIDTGCIGWVCSESGTPGIWKKFGEIK